MASVSGSASGVPGWQRSTVRLATLVVSAVFLLVGVLGFIPGITTGYETMTFAGHHSGAMLFGVFNVSALHNIVHLAFGVLGIALSGTFTAARGYLIGGGLVYAALGLYGLVIDHDSPANFMPVNTADNWLHLGLGAVMILLGVVTTARERARSDSPVN